MRISRWMAGLLAMVMLMTAWPMALAEEPVDELGSESVEDAVEAIEIESVEESIEETEIILGESEENESAAAVEFVPEEIILDEEEAATPIKEATEGEDESEEGLELLPDELSMIDALSEGGTDDAEVISIYPSSVTVYEFERAGFYVYPISNSTYQWQWRENSSSAWETMDWHSNSLYFTAESGFNGRQYRCVVTSDGVSYYSEVATLTVLSVPVETVYLGNSSVAVTESKQTLYRFVAPSAGTYVFTMMGSCSTGGMLYDSSKNVLAQNYGSEINDSFRIEYTLTSGQTVYIRMYYRYMLNDDQGSGTEILNISKKTQDVVIGATNNKLTLTGGNETMCSFVAPYTGTYLFSTSGNLDTVGVLYNSSKSKITEDDEGGDKHNFRIVYALTSGQTVYIGVKNHSSDDYTRDVTLTIISINTQPASTSVRFNAIAEFTVKAYGRRLYYQWQWRSGPSGTWANTTLNDYNKPTLSFTAPTSFNGRQYRCKITNGTGALIYTDPATLTVRTNIEINTQPSSASSVEGSTAPFTVDASGIGLKYQWQWRSGSSGTWANSSINGYNTDTLKVVAQKGFNGRQYRCRITDASGYVVYTDAATLTVNSNIRINTQPSNVYAVEGSTALFSVKASGIGLKYQWQWSYGSKWRWENSSISGYNTDTLKVDAQMGFNDRQYRCRITDASGNVGYTDAATLTVMRYLDVYIQPESTSVQAGSTAYFKFSATGDGLKKQWQWRSGPSGTWANTALNGYSTTMLCFTALAGFNGRQYRCKVTDQYGSVVYTDVVTLTVNTP